MTIKYLRVSTIEQNLDRQLINQEKFDKIFTDKISGSIKFFDRPQGKMIKKYIDGGKVQELHVSSVDRLGRNILDILNVVEYLNQNKVNLFVENLGLFSLVDGKENQTFKLIVSVLGNVAEMERMNMLERQRAGIEAAKAKGTYKGRLHGTHMTDDEILEKYKVVVKELQAGESLRRAAKLGGCSLGTVQKVKRILDKKIQLVA